MFIIFINGKFWPPCIFGTRYMAEAARLALGRWKSHAYMLYIKKPRVVLAKCRVL